MTGRTWTSWEVGELLGITPKARHNVSRYLPWASTRGSGHRLTHSGRDVAAALIYHQLHRTRGKHRPDWHIEAALELAQPIGPRLAIIDPTRPDWWTTDHVEDLGSALASTAGHSLQVLDLHQLLAPIRDEAMAS